MEFEAVWRTAAHPFGIMKFKEFEALADAEAFAEELQLATELLVIGISVTARKRPDINGGSMK